MVGGTTIYLTCGEYEDGTLGEIFVDVAKAGSALRAVMDAFAKTFSAALQYGCPLGDLVTLHKGIDFQPNGEVKGEGSSIESAASLVDWLVRVLEEVYVAGDE